MISSSWKTPAILKTNSEVIATYRSPIHDKHGAVSFPKIELPPEISLVPSIWSKYYSPMFKTSDDPLIAFSCSPWIPDMDNPILSAYLEINEYLSKKKDEVPLGYPSIKEMPSNKGFSVFHFREYASDSRFYEATSFVLQQMNGSESSPTNAKALNKYFGIPPFDESPYYYDIVFKQGIPFPDTIKYMEVAFTLNVPFL